MRRLFCVVSSALLLAGCTTPPQGDPVEFSGATDRASPVVIALIDSGGMPYVPIFQTEVDVTPHVPTQFSQVAISRIGTPEERYAADESLLGGLQTGTLYHFSGTRLFGISFDEDAKPAVIDVDSHGTATSFLAAQSAPEAILVTIQINLPICERRDPTCMDPSIADAMEWIADQTWIDIVSISLANPGNTPNRLNDASSQRYVAASERAAADGKLIINAAGNAIVPSLADLYNGPPWIINVGGYETSARGEAVLASKAVDVVANFTDTVPYKAGTPTATLSGTSLSTPIVAGTLANALDLVRRAEPGRVTSTQELRDALNATATYDMPTGWDPIPPPGGGLPYNIVRASLPVLAQPQMGWGYIDASMAPEIARRVLEQDFTIPPEKDQAAVFQPAWQKAREEFWARYG